MGLARHATRAQPSRARGSPGPDGQPAKARSVGPSRSTRLVAAEPGRTGPADSRSRLGMRAGGGGRAAPRNPTAGTAAMGKPTRRGRLPASGWPALLPSRTCLHSPCSSPPRCRALLAPTPWATPACGAPGTATCMHRPGTLLLPASVVTPPPLLLSSVAI